MHYLSIRRLAPILALSVLLPSCGAPKNDKSGGQVSNETKIEQIEEQVQLDPAPILPQETEPEKTLSDVWDVSDVDVSSIDPTRKLIAFTFDDAPSRTMENIFAVYANFNDNNPDCIASATVFFNGNLFDAQTKHHLHVACALGFELGNHTHTHADLTTLTAEQITDEIRRTDEILEEADGKTYHLLRTPFGKTNETVKQCAFTPLIDWTIDTLDWTGVSADEIYESVFSKRFSGAIVLMHDGYENTVDALKRLLPALKEDGYQVVSVSQLSKLHNCPLKRGNVYIRARKRR